MNDLESKQIVEAGGRLQSVPDSFLATTAMHEYPGHPANSVRKSERDRRRQLLPIRMGDKIHKVGGIRLKKVKPLRVYGKAADWFLRSGYAIHDKFGACSWGGSWYKTRRSFEYTGGT
jgi:hypothetical protein